MRCMELYYEAGSARTGNARRIADDDGSEPDSEPGAGGDASEDEPDMEPSVAASDVDDRIQKGPATLTSSSGSSRNSVSRGRKGSGKSNKDKHAALMSMLKKRQGGSRGNAEKERDEEEQFE